jgi:hypothetical protein
MIPLRTHGRKLVKRGSARIALACVVAIFLQGAAHAGTVESWTEFGTLPPLGPADEYVDGFHILKLYLDSDADVVSISDVRIDFPGDGSLWQVAPPFGSNVEPPPLVFLQLKPSLHFDSWLSTPGATAITGADLPGNGTGIWSDETDDGPQTTFHWGTLTIPPEAEMTFTGRINLAGPDGPSHRWFRIDGRSGQVFVPEPSETACAAAIGVAIALHFGRRRVARAALLLIAMVLLHDPCCEDASAATVSVRTEFHDIPGCAVCATPSPEVGGRVLQLFLTSDVDILGISNVSVIFPGEGELYQVGPPFGSNSEAPRPEFVALKPSLQFDSWLTTPGATTLFGTDLPGDGTGTWRDGTDDGPQTDFQWGTLGSDSPYELTCRIDIAGPSGPVGRWFRIDGETGQVSVPEPSAAALSLAVVAWTAFAFPRPLRRGMTFSMAALVALCASNQSRAASLSIWTELRHEQPPQCAAEGCEGLPSLDLFLTSDADIVSISDVRVNFPNGGTLFQVAPPLGSNTEPPDPAFIAIRPRLESDSWLSTPGVTALTGTDLPGDGTGAWSDVTDDGPQSAFHWGRLGTPNLESSFEFTGRIDLAGPNGPEGRWFRIDGLTGEVSVPESDGWLIAVGMFAGLRLARSPRRAMRLRSHDQ